MELKDISINFTSEELEALYFTLRCGIKAYKKLKIKPNVDNWVETTERIIEKLPIRVRFDV